MGLGSFFQENIVDPVREVVDPIAPYVTAINPVIGAQLGAGQIADAAGQFGESITDMYHDVSGQTAAEAAEAASATQASAMMAQLDYLKEINAAPQKYKEAALAELASIYGIGGGSRRPTGTGLPGESSREFKDTAQTQASFMDRVKASPLYQEIMGGQKVGEEAVLRSAAQTGGLRSGNVQSAMYDYNTQLANRALTQAYQEQVGGLKGLAGLDTGTSQIAGTIGAIGEAEAQGILGASGAQQQGTQNLLNLGLGVAGLLV